MGTLTQSFKFLTLLVAEMLKPKFELHDLEYRELQGQGQNSS